MNLPAISISTTFNYKIPIEEQFARIASAGFPYVSFGANEEHSGILSPSGRQRIKECLQQYRLQLDTIHGPRMDLPDSIKQIHMIADAAAELEVPVVFENPQGWNLESPDLAISVLPCIVNHITNPPISR